MRAVVGDRFALTDTVDRMMGFYTLRDGRVAAFAVHRDGDPQRPADVAGTLRRVYGSLGWVAPAALAALPPAADVYYDVVAQVEVPSWHHGHVVLVGDACQAVSLLAGQGASLAVAGAFVLAEQLAAAASVPEALARYQDHWQPVVVDKQRAGREGVEWFLPSSRTRLLLRRLALALTRIPALSRRLSTALVGQTRVSLADFSADDRSLVGAGPPSD